MKLSDLAGPDAAGLSDVAVFVRADGSESEPFVVTETHEGAGCCYYQTLRPSKPILAWFGSPTVRRLGRGRLVPSRIEMEGDELSPTSMKLAEAVIDSQKVLKEAYREQVATLREACIQAALTVSTYHEAAKILGAALAATGPKPTEDAK